MALLAATKPSEPAVALGIAVLLFLASRPIIRKIARGEDSEWLTRVLTASLILHFLAVPLQIWVVDHFYNGIADWLRYDNQGATVASGFRHFNFSVVSELRPRGLVGDSAVSILTGVVFAVIGINQLGAFFIFSWFAFLGLLLFYRAFVITFGGAGHRRYAGLLFFLPSLVFWTADVSKEAVMTLALGLVAYGASKFLVHQKGGLLPLALGSVIALFVRPNELVLAVGGGTLAVMVLSAAPGRQSSVVRRFLTFAFLSGMLAVAAYMTVHYLHVKTGAGALQSYAKNNSKHGSSVGYSSSPLAYPRDVYTVLFDPMFFNAHGNGERLAAVENLVIVGVILSSLRQLRILIRVCFAKPYVLMCVVYSAAFFYAFAALGNLGLITRERTLLLPFFLVALSIPRAPKGEDPRYVWELRRRDRRRLLKKMGMATRPFATGAPVTSGTAVASPAARRRRTLQRATTRTGPPDP